MRFLIIALAAISIIGTSNAAKADKRVAFVVGNGAYQNVTQLPNPPIDATAMAAVLRNIGFDVVEGINLTRDAMSEKLLDFGKKAQDADIALFFYAGHGIAISGTNYLLPIDADIKSVADVKLGSAINVDDALDQTTQGAKVKLVFLDACRDNPFVARIKSNTASRGVALERGLAEMKSAEGTLIAFATGPGQTALDGPEGTHSPFTNALLRHLTEPGVEVQQVMTEVRAEVNDETHNGQLPWGNTNLIGSVYLNGAPVPAVAASTVTPSSPAAAPAGASTGVELEFWRSVKNSNRPEELNAYLTKYPDGQFKSLALTRLAEIEKGPSTVSRNLTAGIDPATFTDDASQSTEDKLGLDRGQRRDVQRRLNGLGFETKVTGKFDEETRSVIKRWQAARGYPSTGYFNELQHKALLSEIVASTESGSDDASDDRPRSHVRHSGGGGSRYYRSSGGGGGGGGPGGFFGGMMGGLFGHR